MQTNGKNVFMLEFSELICECDVNIANTLLSIVNFCTIVCTQK